MIETGDNDLVDSECTDPSELDVDGNYKCYECTNCKNCSRCKCCDGLEHVNYYYHNEPLEKEEYAL